MAWYFTTKSGGICQFPCDFQHVLALTRYEFIRKEAKGGLQIHVIELGGGASRDDVQTVKVTLTPLLSKEERVRLYRTRYPERWQALETASVEAGLKGVERSLEDEVGD
jgi:hypothetical protein